MMLRRNFMAVIGLTLTVTLMGCSDPSRSPVETSETPSIRLNGESSVTLKQGQMWVDPGSVATDKHGNELETVKSGTVLMDVPGTYEIQYKATDSATGQDMLTSRTVEVTERNKRVVIETLGDGTTPIVSGQQLECADSVCYVDVSPGDSVTLEALASPAMNFAGWTGCTTETSTTCTVTPQTDVYVTAAFISTTEPVYSSKIYTLTEPQELGVLRVEMNQLNDSVVIDLHSSVSPVGINVGNLITTNVNSNEPFSLVVTDISLNDDGSMTVSGRMPQLSDIVVEGDIYTTFEEFVPGLGTSQVDVTSSTSRDSDTGSLSGGLDFNISRDLNLVLEASGVSFTPAFSNAPTIGGVSIGTTRSINGRGAFYHSQSSLTNETTKFLLNYDVLLSLFAKGNGSISSSTVYAPETRFTRDAEGGSTGRVLRLAKLKLIIGPVVVPVELWGGLYVTAEVKGDFDMSAGVRFVNTIGLMYTEDSDRKWRPVFENNTVGGNLSLNGSFQIAVGPQLEIKIPYNIFEVGASGKVYKGYKVSSNTSTSATGESCDGFNTEAIDGSGWSVYGAIPRVGKVSFNGGNEDSYSLIQSADSSECFVADSQVNIGSVEGLSVEFAGVHTNELSWNEYLYPNKQVAYEIYKEIKSPTGLSSFFRIGESSTTDFTDRLSAFGETCYQVIPVVIGVGKSNAKANDHLTECVTVTAIDIDNTMPYKPTLLSSTTTQTILGYDLDAKWQFSDPGVGTSSGLGVAKAVITLNGDNTSTSSQLLDEHLHYQATQIPEDELHCVELVVYDKAGNIGPISDEVCADNEAFQYRNDPAPSPVTNIRVQEVDDLDTNALADATDIRITWDDNSAAPAYGYKVLAYQIVNGQQLGPYAVSGENLISGTGYRIRNFPGGKDYCYIIESVNRGYKTATSAFGEYDSCITTGLTSENNNIPPVFPNNGITDFSYSRYTNVISLYWQPFQDVHGVSKYDIYRSVSEIGNTNPIETVLAPSTGVNISTNPKDISCLYVIAEDTTGLRSSPIRICPTTDSYLPVDTPTNFTITRVGTGDVHTFSWEDSSAVDYALYQYNDNTYIKTVVVENTDITTSQSEIRISLSEGDGCYTVRSRNEYGGESGEHPIICAGEGEELLVEGSITSFKIRSNYRSGFEQLGNNSIKYTSTYIGERDNWSSNGSLDQLMINYDVYKLDRRKAVYRDITIPLDRDFAIRATVSNYGLGAFIGISPKNIDLHEGFGLDCQSEFNPSDTGNRTSPSFTSYYTRPPSIDLPGGSRTSIISDLSQRQYVSNEGQKIVLRKVGNTFSCTVNGRTLKTFSYSEAFDGRSEFKDDFLLLFGSMDAQGFWENGVDYTIIESLTFEFLD